MKLWLHHWMLTCVSVLDNGKVKHYKLKKTENGNYFVSRTRSFKTLNKLVEHYSKQADGLCVRLEEPCKTVTHTLHCNMSWDSVCWALFLCLFKSHCRSSKSRLVPVGVDGGSADSWPVIQHRGPMGDRPQIHQAAEEVRGRAVWRSVRGPVERHHSSRSEDPQTWYIIASFSLTEDVEPKPSKSERVKNYLSYIHYQTGIFFAF